MNKKLHILVLASACCAAPAQAALQHYWALDTNTYNFTAFGVPWNGYEDTGAAATKVPLFPDAVALDTTTQKLGGGAANFNVGVTSHLRRDDDNASTLTPGVLTFATWVKRTGNWTDFEHPIAAAKNWQSWDGDGWWMASWDFGNSIIVVLNGNQAFKYDAGAQIFPLDTWVHVAMTFNSDTNDRAIYINGVPVTTSVPDGFSTPDFITPTASEFRLGHNMYWTGSSLALGALDDVGIWNEELSATRVKALANLANTSGLAYGQTGGAALFKGYDTGTAGDSGADAVVGITQWYKVSSGITGSDGDVVDLGGGNYALNLGGGAGMISGSAIQTAIFTWQPTAGGTFDFNTPGLDNWNAGVGVFPNAVSDIASLASDLTGNQDVAVNVAVKLRELKLGDPDGSHSFSLLTGTAGAVTMESNTGTALVEVLSGSFSTLIGVPLTLVSPTTFKSSTGSDWLELASPLSGSANFVKTGLGRLALTGDSPAFTGTLEVDGGTLSIGDDTTTGSIAASSISVATGSTLVHNRSNAASTALTLTGAGEFQHTGLGGLTLGSGSSLTHSGRFRNENGAGALTVSGNAVINGPSEALLGGTTVFEGTSSATFTSFFSVGVPDGGACTIKDNASVTVLGYGNFNISDTGATRGVLSMQGGQVHCTDFFIAKTNGTHAVVSQSAGSIVDAGATRIGGGYDLNSSAVGVYHISGGSLTADSLLVGSFGTGLMEVSGTGLVEVASWLPVGRFQSSDSADSFGVLDVKGGVLHATGIDRRIIVGEEGTGVMNVRGTGQVICANDLLIGGGAAVLPGSGAVNLLTGGSLTTKSIWQSNPADNLGVLNLNGGTLIAGAASTNFIRDLDAVFVLPGGAVVDTNSNAVTISQPLLAPVGDGVASIPVVSGGSGYVGAPVLKLTGGGGAGATAVANLDGSGGIASVTITSPGVGYTSAPAVAVIGDGGGTGLMLDTPTLAANASGGLLKQGAGALYLNSVNTYTGTTTVSQGFLGGNGSLAGNLTVNAGSGLAMHVTHPGGAAGTDWSVLSVSGTLALPNPLVIKVSSVGFTEVNGTMTAVTTTSGISGLAAVTFDLTDFTGAGSFAANVVGNNLVIQYTVAVGDDYLTWSSTQSWTSGGPGTGGTEDYDGDGMTNDQERLFGLNPTSGASVSPVIAGLSTGGVFTYTRRNPALTGATYTIAASTTLAAGSFATDATATASQSVIATTGDVQTVQVTLSAAAVGGKLFARVSAQ